MHLPSYIIPIGNYLRARLTNPFRAVKFDAEKYRRNMDRAPARTVYAIVFTPRSGSSRLTEILKQTGRLSSPGEVFNIGFVPKMASAYSARTLEEYVAILRRRRNTHGIMGFEVTYSQIMSVFGRTTRFRKIVAPDHWFWLIREDIVLQAISVTRVRQSQIGHDTGVDAGRLAAADQAFAYHGPMIAAQVDRLHMMERGSERMFARFGVTPVRLSYEMLSRAEPAAIASLFARTTGATLPDDLAFTLTHQKLGTDKNLAFAERFRAENAAFMARIDKGRAPMLAALSNPFDPE